jgi:hypothetical protein
MIQCHLPGSTVYYTTITRRRQGLQEHTTHCTLLAAVLFFLRLVSSQLLKALGLIEGKEVAHVLLVDRTH